MKYPDLLNKNKSNKKPNSILIHNIGGLRKSQVERGSSGANESFEQEWKIGTYGITSWEEDNGL